MPCRERHSVGEIPGSILHLQAALTTDRLSVSLTRPKNAVFLHPVLLSGRAALYTIATPRARKSPASLPTGAWSLKNSPAPLRYRAALSREWGNHRRMQSANPS